MVNEWLVCVVVQVCLEERVTMYTCINVLPYVIPCMYTIQGHVVCLHVRGINQPAGKAGGCNDLPIDILIAI